ETGFKIERSTDNFANPANTVQVTTTGANVTFYTNSGLASNTKYYYRVSALHKNNSSAPSNVASGLTLPAAPGSLTVKAPAAPAGRTELDLSWSDNSAKPTAFKIERSPNGTSFTPLATTAVGVTSYKDT